MDHQVQNLLGVSMDKIKEMVDNNTVVGDPITTPDGTVLIPVSKVSYGFAGRRIGYSHQKQRRAVRRR